MLYSDVRLRCSTVMFDLKFEILQHKMIAGFCLSACLDMTHEGTLEQRLGCHFNHNS